VCERSVIIGMTLVLILGLPSDAFIETTRSFTPPSYHVRLDDARSRLPEHCRRTSVTWECADFIISYDLR
jgi:hypothetical protein